MLDSQDNRKEAHEMGNTSGFENPFIEADGGQAVCLYVYFGGRVWPKKVLHP